MGRAVAQRENDICQTGAGPIESMERWPTHIQTSFKFCCHAEHCEASSQAMARWGWAQILRPTQDDKCSGQDDSMRAIANYFLRFDKIYETLL
jgi:hypothetical protein